MSTSLIISLVSLIVAAAAAWFAGKAFFQSRKDAFQSVSQVLLASKSAFLEAYRSIVSDKTITIDQRNYLLEEHASNYCDAFEVACNLYINRALDRELFKDVFKDEIETICNGCGIATFLENPPCLFKGDVYKNIVEVAEEWGIELTDSKCKE